MSIVDAFWMSIGASGRLVDLSRDECLELLGGHVGGPDRVHHRRRAARAAGELRPGGRKRGLPHRFGRGGLSHALETTCAFEIDEMDEFYQSGWSVLAVGGLQLLTEDEFARLQFGKIPSRGRPARAACSLGCRVYS